MIHRDEPKLRFNLATVVANEWFTAFNTYMWSHPYDWFAS